MVKRPRRPPQDGDFEVDPPNAHFMDSGSFTLWTKALEYGKEHGVGEWEFYDTDEFYKYLENYAAFVRKYHPAIDLCANVDVLPFKSSGTPPKGKDSHTLSYRNLKLLEEMGITPVPVVHLFADINVWLRRYVEEGYPVIGLGGLVGSAMTDNCRQWVDRCFNFICPDGKPVVKLHGFGISAHEYILRYPWYSVDSTTWTKLGAFGYVIVPKYRGGRFIFTPQDLVDIGRGTQNWVEECNPWTVTLSEENKGRQRLDSMHYLTMKKMEQEVVLRWLDELGIPIGTETGDWDGAISDHLPRRIANLLFFQKLRTRLPDYADWNWQSKRPIGFGLHEYDPPKVPSKLREMGTIPEAVKPIIFYSGGGAIKAQPEVVIGSEANIMLTYYDYRKKNKPDNRFRRALRARKRTQTKGKKR